MDAYKEMFDRRSPDDWRAQAERFERMAEQFSDNDQLRARFRLLAADALERAAGPPR